MTLKDLENYLHENIPISKAMGITALEVSKNKVTLQANFKKNINHKKTAFGGSLHAVCALSCWSLLYVNLEQFQPCEIIIAQSNVNYLAPVTEDFKAICTFPEKADWDKFLKAFVSKKKGRIALKSQIYQKEQLAVEFTGVFAAIVPISKC